ncbi:dirigent protein 4-like [Dioscorea cayenensis subsp. rotundata]|uniref:Dirigent protein n=1 Tax=Dioscorea cayennensis subsp. rotundata TaxID=55577 RepID=A0AB40AUE6_DIOCR|nr:dirigent protein 4-like [Dioscorea cayenensis subsp. rotundata]
MKKIMNGNLVVLIAVILVSHSWMITNIEGHAYLGKEKVTRLHFYFHDTLNGDHPTTVPVAYPIGTVISPSNLAPSNAVYVADDPLTDGPDPKSTVVGHAQGFYVFEMQDKVVLIFVMDIGFTSGEFNGSSITLFSRNPVLETDREMAVVGGRGKFRLARGFAKLHTYSFNLTGAGAVVEYDVTVFHYEI